MQDPTTNRITTNATAWTAFGQAMIFDKSNLDRFGQDFGKAIIDKLNLGHILDRMLAGKPLRPIHICLNFGQQLGRQLV